nr:reverse transcriptase domain-containing protein [Tanacetum cinerariifolium]GEX06295.1 reverse transcriptase domain-containing protein [Tanacetum cinerariifolium]
MTDKVVLIKENLKAARDRQKSYADNRRKPIEFEVGDELLLKVSPWKGVIRFRKKGKFAPRNLCEVAVRQDRMSTPTQRVMGSDGYAYPVCEYGCVVHSRTIIELRNETTPATVRARTYSDLTDEEEIFELVDIKETNIVLQGLPQDIYNLVNHNKDAKQIWDKVKLLIQGSELSLQKRESKFNNSRWESHGSDSTWETDTKTDDLDAFDSDYDDAPSAKAVLMANLSSYDSDVLSKVADFEKQIHSLKLQLNATVKSHKTLSTIVESLKKDSKQNEDKYLDEVIDLQKKNKALDNVVYKMGQSRQAMHMLTKHQAFYDESHKTSLGYQNPFYLSQARRKVHALYYGHTIVKTHDALSVTDTEEIIELAEESRLKMLAKQNDPSIKEKKVNIYPIDYVALNKLSEHFVKYFMPQKQLSAEYAFWLPVSQPVTEKPPVSSELVLKKKFLLNLNQSV